MIWGLFLEEEKPDQNPVRSAMTPNRNGSIEGRVPVDPVDPIGGSRNALPAQRTDRTHKGSQDDDIAMMMVMIHKKHECEYDHLIYMYSSYKYVLMHEGDI